MKPAAVLLHGGGNPDRSGVPSAARRCMMQMLQIHLFCENLYSAPKKRENLT